MSAPALPPGWRRGTVADALEILTGKSALPMDGPAKAPVLTFKGLRQDGSMVLEPPVAKSVAQQRKLTFARPGDTVWTKQGHAPGWIGRKVGLVREPIFCASTLQVFRPRQGVVDPHWAHHQLRSDAVYREANSSGKNSIGIKELKELPFMLPPISQQHIVVAAIEDAFARIDAIEAELSSVEHLTGRLALKIQRQAVGLECGDDLPRGWRVMRLADIAENLDKRRVPVNRKEREARLGEVPYYGATGRVGWIDKALFDEALVLLGEDGVSFLDPTASKAYRISGPAWVNNHAHVLRPKRGVMTHAFLCLVLNHIDYTGRVNGTTRLKLTQAQMNDLPIPMPPLDDQEDIVAAVDDTIERITAIDEVTTRAKNDLVALRASVLHRAFNGELLGTAVSVKESVAS